MQEQNAALQAQVMALEAALMAAKVSIQDPSEGQPGADGLALLPPGLQGGVGPAGPGEGGIGGGVSAGALYRGRVAAAQAFVEERRVKEFHASGG